jgi:peptidoglycan-associated lipoprotein
MRKILIALPMLLALGCHSEKNDTARPAAAYTEPAPPAPPVQAAAPALKSCTDDAGCDAQQLCIRATCVGISEGLAECGNFRVHFDTDSADLKDEDRRGLDRVARCLKADQTLRVTIEGNADQRGSTEHNVQLGDRRATAVASYLATLGVSEVQLRTVSFGEDNPLCIDKDEGCYSKNRRAAIKTKGGAKAASRRPASM